MLDSLFIWGKIRLGKLAERFSSEETGAVEIVTIVVIIGIVIILAVLFKDKLKELIENLFGKIGTNAENAITDP